MALITFRLPYHTHWGEAIELRYTTSDGQQGRLALETTDGHTWTGRLKASPKAHWLRYDYALTAGGRTVREEQDALRQLRLPEERGQLHVLDSWTEAGIAPVFRHSAFTECIFGTHCGIVREDFGTTGATLTLTALPAPEGWRWGVAGNCPSLGGWDAAKAVPLQRTGTYAWSCQLDEADIRQGFDYKFVLIDGKDP
ncbi:MAG: hypothetical protein IJ729_01115, partial [Alloprevotella sp.]|nr:hypothetical protein [Alloprevotella sp.]